MIRRKWLFRLFVPLVALAALFLLVAAARGGLLHSAPANTGPTATVAFLGDSVTLGAGASSRPNTYTGRVTKALKDKGFSVIPKVSVSVDPAQNYPVAQRVAQTSANVTVIELGAHSSIDQNITADQFRQMYGQILDCLVGSDNIVVVGTVPWLGWTPDVYVYPRAEEFSRIIAEEAAKRGVAVADLWSAMKEQRGLLSTPDQKTFLPPFRGDNFHPGNNGHLVIAGEYIKAIERELANPPQRALQPQCP